jgi:hypothetical protein
MRHFWEDVGLPIAVICAVICAILAAAFVVLFFVFSALNKVECANLTEVTKRLTDFRWLGGCYVEHEGEMLPYARWKLLEVRVKNR